MTPGDYSQVKELHTYCKCYICSSEAACINGRSFTSGNLFKPRFHIIPRLHHRVYTLPHSSSGPARHSNENTRRCYFTVPRLCGSSDAFSRRDGDDDARPGLFTPENDAGRVYVFAREKTAMSNMTHESIGTRSRTEL